jgi:aminoglycoside phosphotransferase (APT) family kinase protein
MSAGTPQADCAIDAALLRALLRDQHPDLAELPITPLDAGWDNAMFRLGPSLAVRMPRRQVAARLLEHEQRWLAMLAQHLPLPVPAPLRAGAPRRGYPWRWSVLPWLDGRTADLAPPAPSEAERFTAFLRALHVPAPEDAPPNPVRGVALRERIAAIGPRLERLRARTDAITAGVEAAWQRGLDAPPATSRRWLHGDLHARNVLVRAGAITGVIDWGDITAGDVATDLAGIWGLFEAKPARDAALARYAPTEAELARARAWAVLFGAVLLDTGLVDHPAHAAMGMAILRRIDAESA